MAANDPKRTPGENMAMCIICGRDAGFFSEFCDNCKDKRSPVSKGRPVSWVAALRTAIISIFGLIPSALASVLALAFFITVPESLLDGKYIPAMLKLGFSITSVFGTYTLCRYLFGRPLHELRAGMIAGLAVMIGMVTQPYVRLYLASLGVEGMLPKENHAFGAGIFMSFVYVVPLILLGWLVYLSWTPDPRVRFQTTSD